MAVREFHGLIHNLWDETLFARRMMSTGASGKNRSSLLKFREPGGSKTRTRASGVQRATGS